MAMTLDQYNQQYAAYGQQYLTLLQNNDVPAWLDNIGYLNLKKATNDLYGKIDVWKAAFLAKYGIGSIENDLAIQWLDQKVATSFKLLDPNKALSFAAVKEIRDALNIVSVTDNSPFFSDINLAITDLATFVSVCVPLWTKFLAYDVPYQANIISIYNFQVVVQGFFVQAITDGVIPPPTDQQYSYSFGNILWGQFNNVVQSGGFGARTLVTMPGLPIVSDKNTLYPVPVLPPDPPAPPPPVEPAPNVVAIVVSTPPIDPSAIIAVMPPPVTIDISNYVAPTVETYVSTGEFPPPPPEPPPPVITAVIAVIDAHPLAATSGPSWIAQMTADGTIKTDGTSSKIAAKTAAVVMSTAMDSQSIIRGNAFVTPPDSPLKLTGVRVLMTPSAQDVLVMMESDDYRFGRISPPEFTMTIFKGTKGVVGPTELTPLASTKKIYRGATPETQEHTYFMFDEPPLLDVDSKYFWVIQSTAPQTKTTKTPVYDNVAQQLNTVINTETTWPKLILHVANDNPVDGMTVISRDGGQTWKSSSLCYSPWELWGYYIPQVLADQINQSNDVPASFENTSLPMETTGLVIPLDSTTPMPKLDLTADYVAEPTQLLNNKKVQTTPQQQNSALWWAAAAAGLFLLKR